MYKRQLVGDFICHTKALLRGDAKYRKIPYYGIDTLVSVFLPICLELLSVAVRCWAIGVAICRAEACRAEDKYRNTVTRYRYFRYRNNTEK